jgi:DNA-binding protein HU-beta
MAKAMTKTQLIAKVAEKAEITRKAAVEIIEFIAEVAYKEAKKPSLFLGLENWCLCSAKHVWVEIQQPAKRLRSKQRK